jgi:hypothetical protein
VEDTGKDNTVEVLEQRVRSQAIGHVLSVEGGAMAMTAYVHLRRLGVRMRIRVNRAAFRPQQKPTVRENNQRRGKKPGSILGRAQVFEL